MRSAEWNDPVAQWNDMNYGWLGEYLGPPVSIGSDVFVHAQQQSPFIHSRDQTQFVKVI